MLVFDKHMQASVGALALASVSFGLMPESVIAGGLGEPSREQIVKVNCDKGQSIQKVLNRFLTRTKPLVVVISGVCDEEIEIERDEIQFEGADSGGRITGVVRIHEAREFGLGENMRIGRLTMASGQAEVEVEEGSVVIDNGVSLTGQSVLSMSSDGPGTITVDADIQTENQSLMTTGFEEGSGGGVVINGGIAMLLQSSANLDGTTIADGVSLSQDSHALFGVGVSVSGSVTCDRQSRVWGDVSGVNLVALDPDGTSCWGDI